MSIAVISVGIIIGIVLGGSIVAFRSRYRDLFPVILVFGIAGLSVVVTIVRIEQYRAEQAATTAFALRAPTPAAEPPPTGPPPQAPVGLPILPPMVRPPTGAAAPPAALPPIDAVAPPAGQNPYRRRSS